MLILLLLPPPINPNSPADVILLQHPPPIKVHPAEAVFLTPLPIEVKLPSILLQTPPNTELFVVEFK